MLPHALQQALVGCTSLYGNENIFRARLLVVSCTPWLMILFGTVVDSLVSAIISSLHRFLTAIAYLEKLVMWFCGWRQ